MSERAEPRRVTIVNFVQQEVPPELPPVLFMCIHAVEYDLVYRNVYQSRETIMPKVKCFDG